tara:strand:- start:212 stop:973 length:762 start_codon:yes stop_codon:yes gene_type:complete
MSTVTDFINKVKLKEGFKFDGQVAELLGIDRRILANWKTRESLPTKYHQWYCDRYDIELKDFRQEIKLTNTDIQLEGAGNMEARKIIELQEYKIESQAIEIDSLKDALQKKQAESTHWESLEFDYIAETTLVRERFKLGRIIDKVTDFKKQSEVLGYTEKELIKMWDIGVKHINMDQHPIEKIINEETQKEIRKQSLTLPIIFDAMKASVGDHYIPQPIIYIHKQGHNVGAIAYCKVEWISMRVTSKVKFLLD